MADAPSAADLAYRHIRDAILTGAYEAGTMLGEIPLAEEIGVSRTPVRTALALLQDEGWVTRYPKRGALVVAAAHAPAGRTNRHRASTRQRRRAGDRPA